MYEALESAGQQQQKIKGSATSVHVAMFTRDYDRILYKDTLSIPRYQSTGTGEAIASNRISYVFDFIGPSMTLDTGCSGGLVAVHQACNTLRLGESDMAIAAAANLVLGPDQQIGMTNLHMLSEDGRSYPFDSRGSGYGRGEGVAALILKPLDKAIEDGDPIRGVILGSAVNQDGRKIEGITHPSTTAQANLERRLYRQLNIDPASIAYVEAHGTGTAAGDRAEMDALAEVFCNERRNHPLYVGSIKSNIGHTECVSGLAGLIKSLLIIENRCIPPNADFRKAKEGLRLDERRIIIPSMPLPSPEAGNVKVSVNSFGYGGTNAHVVVTGAPQPDTATESISDGKPRLFVLTAKSEISLKSMIRQYKSWNTSHIHEVSLSSLSHTLLMRRTHHPWRLSFVANDRQTLSDQLAQSEKSFMPTISSHDTSLSFIFTGQGASWPTMGRELLISNSESTFAKSMRDSTDILLHLGAGWNMIDEILREADTSWLHAAELAQPATTAIQIALVDLLRSIGVQPESVIGHSSGEIAAAYAAGYVSHSTALRIAYSRGIATSLGNEKAGRRGSMLAVGLDEKEVSIHIQNLAKGRVSVACANSPQNTTVSGDEEGIDELATLLSTLDIFNRKLRVDAAYHSHHMQNIVNDYKGFMGLLEVETPVNPPTFFSTVKAAEKNTEFSADYWCDNLVSKVRFKEGLQQLCGSQISRRHILVEIGPHNALAGPARQCIAELPNPIKHDYISPLRRGANAVQSFLEVVGLLFERGKFNNFSLLSRLDPALSSGPVLHNLPSYSWNHSKKHWYESRISREYRFRKHAYHDLVGLRSSEASSFDPRWRHVIGLDSLPWLADHVVDGVTVFPGSGYLSMAIEGISQLAQEQLTTNQRYQVVLRDVEFLKALIVPNSPDRMEVQLSFSVVTSSTDGNKGTAYNFRVAAYNQGHIWDEHCRGCVEIKTTEAEQSLVTTNGHSHEKMVVPEQLYQQLSDNGNFYGPMFKGIEKMSLGNTRAQATIAIPKVIDSMPANYMQPHIIHPTTLDIIMHTSLPLALQKFGSGSFMPTHISELVVSSGIDSTPSEKIFVHTKLVSAEDRTAEIGIEAVNSRDGVSVLSFAGVQLRFLPTSTPTNGTAKEGKKDCWNVKWDADERYLSAGDLAIPELKSTTTSSWSNKVRVLNQATERYVRTCIDAIHGEQLNVADEHHVLFDWMQHEFPCATDTSSNGSNPTEKTPEFDEMKIVTRTGQRLMDIVTGKANALQLVTEDGLLYESQQDHPSMLCYDLLRQYTKHLTFKKAQLRVLEIGGGTGGATLPFLRAIQVADCLPATYDFTDVSSDLFDRAADLLKDYPITFRTLDIEKDTNQQGFSSHSYDVILAANCLHSKSSIRTTLSNVYSLLKDDGRLVMIETVNPQPYHHISYGTLPGYWKESVDGRTNGPFMTIEQWQQAMHDTKLMMQFSAKDDALTHICSLIVARPNDESAQNVQIPVHILPVAETAASTTVSLCEGLRAQGCNVATYDFDHHVEDLDAIKLVLDNGDSPLLDRLTPQAFRAFHSLLNRPSRVMWVTAGTNAASYTDPRRQLITGVARSAQAENDNLRLVTVDIQQSPLLGSPYLVGILYDILQKTFFKPVADREMEYIIRDNVVLIPRLLPSHEVNRWMKQYPSPSESRQVDSDVETDATFVIAGGLGDLGQKLCAHLAKGGAKHLVTITRRSLKSDTHRKLLNNLPADCQLHHIQCDISKEEDLKEVLATIAARGLPAVRGVIQSAAALQVGSLLYIHPNHVFLHAYNYLGPKH